MLSFMILTKIYPAEWIWIMFKDNPIFYLLKKISKVKTKASLSLELIYR